jgi:hypothetical protein
MDRRPFLSALFALLLLAACAEPPETIAHRAHRAFAGRELAATLGHIAADYRDPLGDKAALERDLNDLIESTGRIEIELSELTTLEGATKQLAAITGRLDVHLVGEPEWKSTGPLELELKKDGEFQIVSGFLTDLRDVRKLMKKRRAALEANDAKLYGALLHPTYRDGDVDRADTQARIDKDLSTNTRIRLEPTLYRLEMRGPMAHLDEHYLLKVNDAALPASIARFTLRPAAGFWRIAAGLYPEPQNPR